MLKDIYEHDNPAVLLEHEQTCAWGHICAHKDCPVFVLEQTTGRDLEEEGLIKVNSRDDVTRCSLMKPKALAVLNFLSRMFICAAVVFGIGTVLQVPLVVTIASGFVAVGFHSIWRWLEGRKAF